MRIRRGLMFVGLFLIPLGAIPLLVRAGYLPDDLITGIWRWWPLLLVGLGIALLLGRSKAGLIGTAVIALVLGTLGRERTRVRRMGVRIDRWLRQRSQRPEDPRP